MCRLFSDMLVLKVFSASLISLSRSRNSVALSFFSWKVYWITNPLRNAFNASQAIPEGILVSQNSVICSCNSDLKIQSISKEEFYRHLHEMLILVSCHKSRETLAPLQNHTHPMSSAKSRSSNWLHSVHWIPFLLPSVLALIIQSPLIGTGRGMINSLD